MLPAAASLQKQGANKGATTAFLISTPESGVDSIAVTYALLDPVMTLVRPIAAFVTAISAGLVENLLDWPKETRDNSEVKRVPVLHSAGGDCCDTDSGHQPTLKEKVSLGFQYAVKDVWGDIVVWFFIGLILAAFISALIPETWMESHLGGGITSMLIMLVIGIPLYICATASTPVAAALILKGVSPGAALVFLLVGPATNVTSLSVLFGILGKKSTFRYLLILSVAAILFGLGVDYLYRLLGISPKAILGSAGEVVPYAVKVAATLLLLIFSIRPLTAHIRKLFNRKGGETHIVSTLPDLRSSGGAIKLKDQSSLSGCNCKHKNSPEQVHSKS
nr:SO_0444 family Cu/Zn efflux transporter [Desulfopila sp. IMCC35008]